MNIHTLDTRSYVYWDVFSKFLKKTNMKKELTSSYNELLKETKKRNIDYSKLRNMLTPQRDRFELCLFFDSEQIDNSFYGSVVFNKYFPLIEKCNNVCVFEGDLIGDNKDQDFLVELMNKHLFLNKNIDFKHSNQFFIVYINNLSKASFNNIILNLLETTFFVGCMDATFGNRLKDYISLVIGQSYFIHNNNIVVPIPDTEYYCEEDYNNFPYSITDSSLSITTLPETVYNSFLRFKIVRSSYSFDKDDQIYSLNLLSDNPIPIDDFSIRIDEEKFEYLVNSKKIDSLNNLGLGEVTLPILKNIIKASLNINYIFNISFYENTDTMKFNIPIDIVIEEMDIYRRFVVSFEYLINEKQLRLITFF